MEMLPRTVLQGKTKPTIIETNNIIEITTKEDIFNIENKKIVTTILSVDNDNYIHDHSNYLSFPETHLLKFENVPKGDPMRLPGFHLTAERSLFNYLSKLISYLEPTEYPLELIKKVVHRKSAVSQLIVQLIQMESGFLTCLMIGFTLALLLPFCLIVYGCCEIFDKSYSNRLIHKNDDLTIPTLPFDHDISWAENCRRRVYVFIMEILLIFLLLGISGIFLTNSHFATSIQKSPRFVNAVFDDINTYVKNSHLQINFLLASAIEQTIDAVQNDLDEAEKLLGRPIQHTLAAETGIDVVQDALMVVNQASQEISIKVANLLDECQKTLEITRTGQIRLRELRRHVESTLRQCTNQDKQLCGTLDSTNLEIILKVDLLLADPNLSHLEFLSNGNLTKVIKNSRTEFENIPRIIVQDIRKIREDITKILTKHRKLIFDSVQILNKISHDVTFAINNGRNITQKYIQLVSDFEFWYWAIGFCTSIFLLILWTLITISLCCGCCGNERKVTYCINFVLILITIFSIGLWALTIMVFIIGGHLEVFVCRPLYDEPNYEIISNILDKPGVIFQSGGWLSNILQANESLDLPISHVLRKCRENQALYPTFQLNRIYDYESIINHRSWMDLYDEFNKIQLNIKNIQLLTPDLQQYLQELIHATQINFTEYRKQLSVPITGKDLHSFANQLDGVATQISDFMTASRLETLSSRTLKFIETHVQPLQKHREAIVYILTALEIQVLPIQIQANQSLAHLKTIQYYVQNQGAIISEQRTTEYINRLIGYLDQYRSHVLNELNHNVGGCFSVWNVLNSIRIYTCKQIMDPLNGYWFFSLWCLMILMCIAPLSIKIGKCYRKVVNSLEHTDSHMSLCEAPIDTLTNTWQTPEPEINNSGW